MGTWHAWAVAALAAAAGALLFRAQKRRARQKEVQRREEALGEFLSACATDLAIRVVKRETGRGSVSDRRGYLIVGRLHGYGFQFTAEPYEEGLDWHFVLKWHGHHFEVDEEETTQPAEGSFGWMLERLKSFPLRPDGSTRRFGPKRS